MKRKLSWKPGYLYCMFELLLVNRNIDTNVLDYTAVLEQIKGEVPKYCSEPSTEDLEFMHKWIDNQLKLRCHPTRYINMSTDFHCPMFMSPTYCIDVVCYTH